MATSAIDRSSAASTGCCMGQARMAVDGLGLADGCRAAAVTALRGFQSAMARKTAGGPGRPGGRS